MFASVHSHSFFPPKCSLTCIFKIPAPSHLDRAFQILHCESDGDWQMFFHSKLCCRKNFLSRSCTPSHQTLNARCSFSVDRPPPDTHTHTHTNLPNLPQPFAPGPKFQFFERTAPPQPNSTEKSHERRFIDNFSDVLVLLKQKSHFEIATEPKLFFVPCSVLPASVVAIQRSSRKFCNFSEH